jgi:signal transduction histidine kinase
MSADARKAAEPAGLPEETVLLLNRAMLVMHSVRTAAHELNNVLQMITGSVELLQGNPALSPALRPRLDAIARHTRRGEDLVRGIADLARRESPGVQTVDLAAAARKALETRYYEHGRAGISCSVGASEAGAAGRVRADPQEIEQLLLSLIINAEQAIGVASGGAIRVTVEGSDGAIELTIEDNGNGEIPADALEPFVSARSPRIAAGLGLAAAHAIAARLGGEFSISRAEGRTLAKVRLPSA